MRTTVSIKFKYEGKKYNKKAHLFRLATGAYVINRKKEKESADVYINDFCEDEERGLWAISFEDGDYLFEVYFELSTDVDDDKCYTFNPSHILVWSSDPEEDGIIDEIEIDSVKVS